MGKRIYQEDITSLALLYNYEATQAHSRMLPHSMLKAFDKIIDDNLDEIDSKLSSTYPIKYSDLIWSNTQDEEGNWYSVLKYACNIKKAKLVYETIKYRDLIEASKKANALATLGINLIDGKMSKIQKKNERNILEEIIEKEITNSHEFYKKIASMLSIEEREFLKKQIENKCCLNCTNPSCRIPYYEKTLDSCCIGWENQEAIGKQLILKK